MQHHFGVWLDHFPEHLTPGRVALDIGCGRGNDTCLLLDAGLSVVALDRKLLYVHDVATRAIGASFLVANLRAGIPLCDQTIDLAVASLSLHYFDTVTTDCILRDIHRVTTTGAILLARVNTVGDVASQWGVGIEHEPDFFEVEPGRYKRFFTETTLTSALDPYFSIDQIFPMSVLVDSHYPKQTLVVQATRRGL